MPRGTSTRLIASPSGMLWTAIAVVMNAPSASPPPNETPTATPSVNECTVITPTISSALTASAPRRIPRCDVVAVAQPPAQSPR